VVMKPLVGGGDESLTRSPSPETHKLPAFGPAVCLLDRLSIRARARRNSCPDFSFSRTLLAGGPSASVSSSVGVSWLAMQSRQVPSRRLARRFGWPGYLSLLRSEAADPVEVVGGEGEPEQEGDLHPGPKTRKKPRARLVKEPWRPRVHRLDRLTAIHRDRPGTSAEGDPLGQRQLSRRS
jgi:hypothetical protein